VKGQLRFDVPPRRGVTTQSDEVGTVGIRARADGPEAAGAATGPRGRLEERIWRALPLRGPQAGGIVDAILAAADSYAAALIEQQMRSPYAVRSVRGARGGDAA